MSSFLPFWNTQSSTDQNESCFPSLTYKERIIGFTTCFVLGILIEIISFGSFLSIMTGHPAKFALCYSFGNILTLIGTSFLIGFKRQVTSMTNKTRVFTTIIFIASLVMTLVSALVFKKPLLVLLFLIIQICSYIWYVASYIPFARDCLKSCLKRTVDLK